MRFVLRFLGFATALASLLLVSGSLAAGALLWHLSADLFVGSAPELAVGVFLGYDRPRSLGKTAYGAGHAAPIVRAFLEQALAGKPHTAFRVPAGIKLIPVDPFTGTRSAPGAGAILEAFKPGTEPPAAAPPPVADGSPGDIQNREAYAPSGPTYFR
ncbi:hypothetical protein [Microvirga yunnanensis]|uniref:hypothetical protein n=1 Tax=Microvirga yunnanensis TaxID=2953740 RepID=UPI00359F7F42